MEARLRRLAIAIAVLGFLIFGPAALWHEFRFQELKQAVSETYRSMNDWANKCISERILERASELTENVSKPITQYCDWAEATRQDFHELAAARDEYGDSTTLYAALAFIVPITSLIAFFVGKWVITGSMGSFSDAPSHLVGRCKRALRVNWKRFAVTTIIFVVIAVIWAIRPERAASTLLSSLVQVAVIVPIFWLISKVFSQKKRNPRGDEERQDHRESDTHHVDGE
mgnify:CR=1 FL=1